MKTEVGEGQMGVGLKKKGPRLGRVTRPKHHHHWSHNRDQGFGTSWHVDDDGDDDGGENQVRCISLSFSIFGPHYHLVSLS